jgi:hypothetical protein
MLLVLRDTFRANDLIGLTKNKQIYPAPSDWSFELTHTIMIDFLFPNWCVTFGVLSNPVTDLLLRISIKNSMLSSISCRMQTMIEYQSQSTSWTINCSHQHSDRNWNIAFQFGDITNIRNRLTSELDFLKNCILLEEFAKDCWDPEFNKVCREDFKWHVWLYRHSL